MTKQFTYATLRYRPSQVLEEQVNVGLVFLFLEEKRIEFIIAHDVEERINKIALEENSDFIIRYINLLKETALNLNKKEDLGNDVDIILGRILIPDSSSLFFDKPKTGLYRTAEQTITYYSNLFFPKRNTTEQTEQFIKSFLEEKTRYSDFKKRKLLEEEAKDDKFTALLISVILMFLVIYTTMKFSGEETDEEELKKQMKNQISEKIKRNTT